MESLPQSFYALSSLSLLFHFKWTNFHFSSHKLFMFPAIPRDATMLHVRFTMVSPIQIGCPTTGEPPTPIPFLSTVRIGVLIIIPIQRTKWSKIVQIQSVPGRACVAGHLNTKMVPFTVQFKMCVSSVGVSVVEIPQFNAKFVLFLIGNQEKFIVTPPEFVRDKSESVSIIGPVSIKVLRSVPASLKRQPTTAIRFHITPNFHRTRKCRQLNVILATFIKTRFL